MCEVVHHANGKLSPFVAWSGLHPVESTYAVLYEPRMFTNCLLEQQQYWRRNKNKKQKTNQMVSVNKPISNMSTISHVWISFTTSSTERHRTANGKNRIDFYFFNLFSYFWKRNAEKERKRQRKWEKKQQNTLFHRSVCGLANGLQL